MSLKNIFSILMLLACLTATAATPETTPALQHVMDLDVTVSEAINVGNTPDGYRLAIPITGGTFEGPDIRGTISAGGADYQLVDTVAGRTRLEAIYCIRTDDGHNIHVRNCGLLLSAPKEYYFYTSPTFEAATDGPYAWLNDAIYICRPVSFKKGGIKLRVWRVCDN